MNNCYGEKLMALSAAIAIQIAQYTNNEELNVLGALFTTIGDQLSLLAAVNASCSPDNKKEVPVSNKTAAPEFNKEENGK